MERKTELEIVWKRTVKRLHKRNGKIVLKKGNFFPFSSVSCTVSRTHIK